MSAIEIKEALELVESMQMVEDSDAQLAIIQADGQVVHFDSVPIEDIEF